MSYQYEGYNTYSINDLDKQYLEQRNLLFYIIICLFIAEGSDIMSKKDNVR